jgi:cobalt-zinc-cadmium resistance protein CzcA
VRALVALYRPVVGVFVRFRVLAELLALVLLGVGAAIFPKLGSEFTPRLMEGDIIANLTMAPSVSLEETKRNTLIAERRLLEIPEIAQAVSRIGRGEVGAHADPINTVHMMVVLKPRSEWREGYTQVDLENAMREKLAGMPGVEVNMTQPIQLSVDELIGGTKAQLAIKLFGADLDLLKAKGEEIAAVVRAIQGAADVQAGQVIGSPQIVVRPDREAIARHGLNLAEVQQLIEAAVGGVEAGQIYEGVQRFDIYVRYRKEARDTVEDLRHLIVQTGEGVLLPLDELATVEEIVGPRQIVRENNQRYLEVQANVVGRDIGGFVEEAQTAIDAEVRLPPGYLVSWGGQYELQQEANQRLAVVVPVTLASIALLLYVSFGSLKNTALILLNIPLALVGGIVGLWLAGENLSVPSSIGFIALFGIALGNGIGARHLFELAAARGAVYRRGQHRRRLSAGAPRADDGGHHLTGSPAAAADDGRGQRGASAAGCRGYRRAGVLDYPDPAGAAGAVQVVRHRPRPGGLTRHERDQALHQDVQARGHRGRIPCHRQLVGRRFLRRPRLRPGQGGQLGLWGPLRVWIQQ